MDDLLSQLTPTTFKGGPTSDYVIEVLSNGGLGSRHIPTGQVVPHVKTLLPQGQLEKILPQSPLPTGNSGHTLQAGLQFANLGVGLLNLGVSAWTAWKVHKIDQKIDVLSDGMSRVENRLEQLDSLLMKSVTHLDGLIQKNTLMLGLIIESQVSLGEGLAILRQELAQGFHSVHEALSNVEARGKAQALQQHMNVLFRYYQLCTHEMLAGRTPPISDLRNIVTSATQLIAWLDTQLSTLAAGSAQKLPFITARIFALRLEVEARLMLDEAPESRQAEFKQVSHLISDEIVALMKGASLLTLAEEHSLLIEHYVFLRRSLQGCSTLIEYNDGQILPYYPREMLSWDDGLQQVREIVTRQSDQPHATQVRLKTLRDHAAWQQLKGLPRGASPEIVSSDELADLFGLPQNRILSEDNMRDLLCTAPKALAENKAKLMKEVN